MVKNLPEVKSWLKLFSGPGGISPVTGGKPVIEFDSMEEKNYVIHVYEEIPRDHHTATFDWYFVNLSTGEIRSSFGNLEDLQ